MGSVCTGSIINKEDK
ncbi:hypothetical protein CCU_26740 [Coprococcus sp. ART55/1]|nr:hypothetical protein CCU_26740 [Coprococcus sp. ART55/1]